MLAYSNCYQPSQQAASHRRAEEASRRGEKGMGVMAFCCNLHEILGRSCLSPYHCVLYIQSVEQLHIVEISEQNKVGSGSHNSLCDGAVYCDSQQSHLKVVNKTKHQSRST